MKRFVITGAPGSGKTSILHALRDRGYSVVGEAATDIISAEQSAGNEQPWNEPLFISKLVKLQRSRQLKQVARGIDVQIYDRSPVCTLALAKFLGLPVPTSLAGEIDRIIGDRVYEHQVFLVRPIGFVEPTAARRISYQQSLEFERYHADTYVRLGFELVDIPAGEIEERAAMIDCHIKGWA